MMQSLSEPETYGGPVTRLRDLLLEDPTEHDLRKLLEESKDDPNHGLAGTQLQKKILKLANECEDMELDEAADWLNSDVEYVGSVLRRADKERWTELFTPWDGPDHTGEWLQDFEEDYEKVRI